MLETILEYLQTIDLNNLYQIMKTSIESNFNTEIQSPESMITAFLVIGTIGYFIFDIIRRLIPIFVVGIFVYILLVNL